MLAGAARRATRCRWARTSASATAPGGRCAAPPPRRAFVDARGGPRRDGRRDRVLHPHPGLVDRGGGRRRPPLPRGAVPGPRADRPRRQARAHARLPDGEPRAPAGCSWSPATASTRAAPGSAARTGWPPRTSASARRSRRAADCWSRPTCSTSRATSTARSTARVPPAPTRREAVRGRRRAGRADAPRRQGRAPDRPAGEGPALLPCSAAHDDHRRGKARAHHQVRRHRDRHRGHPGPDRDAHAPHQPPDGASANAQARSSQPPRPADARRPPPALPELPAEEGSRGLPLADPRARPAR